MLKKNNEFTISPFAETRNMDVIQEKSGNFYKSLVVMGKRANQINQELKKELHAKLNEFATTSDNLEEVFENREQIEISKYYEKLPNPAVMALDEFLNDEIYFREKDDTSSEEA